MAFNTKNFKNDELIHLLWIDWDNKDNPTLSIQYRKLSSTLIEKKCISLGDSFDFKVNNYVCIGYPDENDRIILCSKNQEINKGIQCFQCIPRDQLLGCARCKGVNCVNKPAWQYCNRTKHAVYLAGFHTGLVKVGTSKRDRLQRRLLEQGATTACVIAYTSTQISAKYIEHRISQEYQVPDAVSEKIKAEALTSAQLVVQKKAINSVRDQIANNLKLSEIVLQEPIIEYNAANFSGHWIKLPVETGTTLKGNIVFARGRHIILRYLDTNYLVDMFKLRGAVVEIGSSFKPLQKKSLFNYF
jgi:hypothetical protein